MKGDRLQRLQPPIAVSVLWSGDIRFWVVSGECEVYTYVEGGVFRTGSQENNVRTQVLVGKSAKRALLMASQPCKARSM